MCYNGCQYEQHNPMTGDCHCRRGNRACPEEEEEPINMLCPYCECEIEDPVDLMNCPECEATIHL